MISPAFAQTAGGGGGFNPMDLFPFVVVIAIFYFLLFRPQQKKLKEQQAMIESIKRGDTVVTSGGIIGKVIRVGTDGELKLEIAENVQIRVLRGSIADVRGKGEPVKDKGKAEIQAGGDGNPPSA